MRVFWIERGSSECQHSMGPFTQSAQKQSSSSKRLPFCTQAFFTRVHVNGEKADRNWLCYSPTIGNVYCFICNLMSKQTKDPGNFSNVGFRDWKHADRAISRHEGSKYHRDSILAVMTLGTVSGRIDTQIVEASKSERQFLRDFFARVVAVVKFWRNAGSRSVVTTKYLDHLQMGFFLVFWNFFLNSTLSLRNILNDMVQRVVVIVHTFPRLSATSLS